MNNLFSIFDPTTSIFALDLSLNWVSTFIYLWIISSTIWSVKSKYLKIFSLITNNLEKELSLNLGSMITPGATHLITSLFCFLAINNFMGLSPYIFTSSSHLTFSVALALTFWLGLIVMSYFKDLGHNLAHLVPLGTPYPLIPLMVMIELISNIIRPLTLSVRLAANMVAGHLLLALISGTVNPLSQSMSLIMISAIVLLMVLENAVALIQAYVFSMLPSLYVAEVNSSKMNY